MGDFKLPNHLRRHFTNLSVTIQSLIGEIVLAVDGFPVTEPRTAQAEFETAVGTKYLTKKPIEQMNDHLREFITCHQLSTEDATIALATVSGRSTKEIAHFLGLESRYVMRRLCAVRKAAAGWKPEVQLSFPFEDSGECDVIELFAEAQRR